jgi:DNA ligase 1
MDTEIQETTFTPIENSKINLTTYEPLLAPKDIPDLKTEVTWPMMMSIKRDGIRCIIINGRLYSRKMKPIPNINLYPQLDDLIQYSKQHHVIFDGELYTHYPHTFSNIISFCMSDDKPIPKSLKFHMIDMLTEEEWLRGSYTESFKKHHAKLKLFAKENKFANFMLISQHLVKNSDQAEKYLNRWLGQHFEGAVLRCPNKGYRHGKATVKQHWIFKVKPFDEYDAKIIQVYEGTRMKKNLERKTNAQGKLEPVMKLGEREPNGTFGKFLVKLDDGRECEIGNWKGLTKAKRAEIWANKDKYLNQWIRFKGQRAGVKTLPRIPKDLVLRDAKD